MYQSTYLTVRVNTVAEAVMVTPTETVDRLLWLIDVHDIGEGCAPAVHNVLMDTYHDEQERVPGILPRWTRTMLAWVTLLHCRTPFQTLDNTHLSAIKWGLQHHLLFNTDYAEWTVEDVLDTLDCIAMRWKQLSITNELKTLLQMVWNKCRYWTVHQTKHPSQALERVRDSEWYVVKPVSIMAMLSRYYWFNQTMDQLEWFPHHQKQPPPHFFSRFIAKEKRHLKIQRFRDALAKEVWERTLFYGDREIAIHDQLGDTVSAYTCLYKRHPICLMQTLQKKIAYGTYDDICACCSDILWLQMIRVHFVNNYRMDFVKFFVCWEIDQHRHHQFLKTSLVPIILERFGKFTVLYNGHTYGNDSIQEIFPLWVHYANKPHGLNLDQLRKGIFAETVHVDEIELC